MNGIEKHLEALDQLRWVLVDSAIATDEQLDAFDHAVSVMRKESESA